MNYLKEDGGLDVGRIRELPLEEKHRVMGGFTREQMKEYISKLPVNKTHGPIILVKVNNKMEDLLA